MGDLGLEVAAIDDAVNDLTDAVGAVAERRRRHRAIQLYRPLPIS